MSDTAQPVGPGSLVCVTGANGFIASHLVKLLLERGFRVRATVRDCLDDGKTAHLVALAEDLGAGERLELYSADLLEPGSFDDAIAGCDGVFHPAAAVILTAKDPQREIVDPSIEGTLNVLRSAAAAGTVRRFVHTSSVAAVYDFDRPASYVYTEADWNDASTLRRDPYGLAKVSAERAALAFAASLPEAEGFEVVHLNPGMVWGPPLTKRHCKTSPLLIREALSGSRPGLPRMDMAIVDVRDVAAAHVAAMERPDASGRYILVAGHEWLPQVGVRLQQMFPELKVTTRSLPNVFVLAAALMGVSLGFAHARRMLDHRFQYDASRARTELGIEFRPIDETLRATAAPMIEQGWARTQRR